MASLPATCLLPVGLDLLARRFTPSMQHAARVLRWSHSSVAAPFSFADPHDDPSLRALYEPYPSGAPSSDIFETEELSHSQTLPIATRTYQNPCIPIQEATTFPTLVPHITRSNALLIRCIEQEDYAGATSLRRDLDALHTPIAPNALYAKVAHHVLKNPDQSNPHAFLEWCELVPNLSDPWSEAAEMPSFMTEILHSLLQKPEDIDTLCRFSMLAVRKGMAKYVSIPTISHVTCYSPPEVASKLLSDFTKAAVAYSQPSRIPLKFTQSWNGTFIRTLCLSGRIDTARQNLLALHGDKRKVGSFTYCLVAEELEALGRVAEAEEIRTLHKKAGFYEVKRVQSPTLRKTTPMPAGTLAEQLRWIRQRIDANLNVSVNDFASFLKVYLSAGHRRAPSLLRNRLTRLSGNRRWKQTLGFWGTAEMKLYRSEGKHEEVIRVFQSTFLPVGITTGLTNALGLSWASSPLSNKRLWPSSEAVALASWSAARLASHRKDIGLLERCYSLFLEGCRPNSDGLFELPPSMRPDAAAFQPWVGAFARISGPQGIVQIMKDMRERGISPSRMTWNTLAKAYVANKEWDVAKTILANMEASRAAATHDATVSTKMRLRNRLGPLPDWGFPVANRSTYYTLLRELCMTRQMSAAQELIHSLVQAGYEPGDKRLDSFIEYVKRSLSNNHV